MKSRPRRSHSYCEGVMMFQRGDSMDFHLRFPIRATLVEIGLDSPNLTKVRCAIQSADRRDLQVVIGSSRMSRNSRKLA